ncbi:DUF5684 domain-containing protein [Microbacterium lacus]|uniref:DUF5684 domain-containing protein n=1 Tax=Microbacterium lacus TaxID=415217 RepID=UPI000C2C6C36|nr:DUF5684 domain-containing protein [Microbacterium lacus]
MTSQSVTSQSVTSQIVTSQITDQADLTALYTISGVWGLIWYIILAIALWRTFSKAGWPGILAIIPIVNIFILVKVGGMSAWLGLLYIIPIVNFIFAIVVAVKVGKNFGHGGVFSFFLLFLLQPIGYLILGFGKSEYRQV